MKVIKLEYKVYSFDELDDNAKQKAVDNLYDINIHDDWFEAVYEDAKTVGVDIQEFDIARGSCCTIRMDYEDTVIQAILKNHGELCDTYKVAAEYKDKILDSDGNINAEIAKDFKRDLQETYLSMLRREYEYLTGEDAIIETIQANDYEFTENGKIH